ncbi:MAG: hypothetical protein ACTSQ3_00240 [Candidatus Heimdallarchaeota archaeon]
MKKTPKLLKKLLRNRNGFCLLPVGLKIAFYKIILKRESAQQEAAQCCCNCCCDAFCQDTCGRRRSCIRCS